MDIEQELKKALADPEIMSKVGSLLSQMGTENEGEPENAEEKTENNLPEGKQTESSQNILSALSSGNSDDRTRLLIAIKPFLSEKRAPYVDSALTILKLVNMGKLGKNLKLF